ncbi:MAG: alpha/beta hydrolase [Eubacteriales bacterium]|nr:alpha/beta hydrolase [Eubacteriales bacterium]
MKDRYFAYNIIGDMSQIPKTSSIFGMSVGRIYYTDGFNMDPYTEISGYQKDVLIVQGDQDDIVPISYAERAADVYSSAELITINGGGHGFYGEQFETASGSPGECWSPGETGGRHCMEGESCFLNRDYDFSIHFTAVKRNAGLPNMRKVKLGADFGRQMMVVQKVEDIRHCLLRRII